MRGQIPLELMGLLEARLLSERPELIEKLRAIGDRVRTQENSIRPVAELAEGFESCTDHSSRLKLLDELCCYPSSAVAGTLVEAVKDTWEQERAELILTCRFGPRPVEGWNGWRNWLMRAARKRHQEMDKLRLMLEQNPAEGFVFWYAGQCTNSDFDEPLYRELNDWCDEHPARVIPDKFVERWSEHVPADEWNALTGVVIDVVPSMDVFLDEADEPVVEVSSTEPTSTKRTVITTDFMNPSPIEPTATASTPGSTEAAIPTSSAASDSATDFDEVRESREPHDVIRSHFAASSKVRKIRVAPDAPRQQKPPGPSLWGDHIQPFFAEHWYMVAGVVMMIAGSSLLAYYTWDKHWAVRYTIMPALLGCCTAGLAWMGSWTERQDEHFKGTAAILRGAAIGLLPINFMAVALLSNDLKVSNRAVFVPLMSIIYLGLFGFGLRSWCAAMYKPLGLVLGGTLLLINSLVMIGPLAKTIANVQGNGLLLTIGIGFHLGFLVLAAVVVRFTSHVLTPEIAEQKRIPWFSGATLAITFLQVFAWVHGFLQHLPQVFTYAPMIIMSGGLVLFVERRALRLNNKDDQHGEESFVEFSLIALGVLMGATEPYIRVLSFALAGVVWLTQTLSRREPMHHSIGLTFLMLGAASVAMLDVFPRDFLPMLGIGISIAMGVASRIARRFDYDELRKSTNGMQVAVLFLTTIVTVLAQWHYNSPPLHTGGYLLLLVGMFGFRAYRDNDLRWVHTAMGVLAVSLMYLGCLNMSFEQPSLQSLEQVLEGNTMVFGLSAISILWLMLNTVSKHPLIRDARSTVLWVYGALAVAGMVLRVLVETKTAPTGLALWMDYSGPLLMSVVLIFATWYSRSLIPAIMAAVIVIILFPELKAQFQESFESLGWGSGLGSAISALVLTIVCFPLQKTEFLKNLGEGDRFLGKELFPIRRYDHSLFTWPLLASVLSLTFKTDTWTLIQNLLKAGPLSIKTSIALFVGVVSCFSFSAWTWVNLSSWAKPLLITGATLHIAYFAYRNWAADADWVDRVLARPTSHILRGSCLFLAVICVSQLYYGINLEIGFALVVAMVSGQLIWQALSENRVRFLAGSLLFILHWTMLVALQTTVAAPFWARVTFDQGLMVTLEMVIVFQLFLLALEFQPAIQKRLSGITLPYLAGTSVISITFSVLVAIGVYHQGGLNWINFGMLILATLLTARAHGSGVVGLLAMVTLYVEVMFNVFGSNFAGPVNMLLEPVPLALFALALAVMARVGQTIYQRQPLVVAGQFDLRLAKNPQSLYFYLPAVSSAALAALIHTIVPDFRADPNQLWAPYLAATTLLVVGRTIFAEPCRLIGTAILTLGNIHLLRVFFGESLAAHGVSDLQVVCLGVAMTLLQGTLVKLVVKRESLAHFVNQASLFFAGTILGLIAVNYIVDPNLAKLESLRFVISGSMPYLAGLYFRRAARHPDVGEVQHTKLCEGFYHVGVTIAIWCLVLLVPWFRQPAVALCSLGFPLAYFYIRAENSSLSSTSELSSTFERYRNSGTVLAFVIVAGYVFRSAFQMILFPGEPILQTAYYHYNAPFIMLLSVVMLRLHGLGGTSWLAFYGGLALMTGTYFSVTWFPKLSPFTHPMAAAWAALALAHFWTLVSNQRSPLRTGIQQLAAIDGQHWFDLRRSWGMCLLIATQVGVAWGLTQWETFPLIVAPLLVASASILIHQGAIRRAPVYLGIAGCLIVAALHADFFVESYLSKGHVVWAILGAWAAVLVIHRQLRDRTQAQGMGIVAGAFAAFAMLHVFYHDPGSITGLVTVSIGGVLAAHTPRETRFAKQGEQATAAGLLLVIPTWLAFFSQANLMEEGFRGAFNSLTLLLTTSVLFITGAFARVFHTRLYYTYDRMERSRPCLFDQTLSLLGSRGCDINSGILWVSFGLTIVAQFAHYGKPFVPHELGIILALYAGLVFAWVHEGRLQANMAPYFALQLSVLGFFAVIRRQLVLTTDFWRPKYDVWASLVVSFGLTGAKQLFAKRPQEVRIPLMGTLLTLPIVAVVWTMYHGLGVNVAMLVVGLHSLMFTFMGKDDRESPYNIIAILGFVVFVLIGFWSKLELRVLHAYTIPVGVAVLVLLQMFRSRIDSDTRNHIRLVTLLIMIGSAGYYALADDNYPIAYNLIMIGACIMAMLMGSFFRIRMYLVIGFAGLMVDVLSIVFKVLKSMNRDLQMTVIGSLVLLVGVGLVFGAIYYKTHRDGINQRLNLLRAKVGDWE